MTKLMIKRFYHRESNNERSIQRRFRILAAIRKNIKPENNWKYSLDDCKCGWNTYYSQVFGVRFPCVHEILNPKFEKCPIPQRIELGSFESINHTDIVTSKTRKIFKNEKKLMSITLQIESLDSIGPYFSQSSLGPRSSFAKTEMWKVVNEMTTIYGVDEKTAIDIAIDEFAKLDLHKEDCATTENIAIFRISCWNYANEIAKRNGISINE